MVPMEIGNLSKSLKILKLASNRLKQITNRVKELKSLEVLHVQNNKLTALPDGFENLR
jgi:Leucine-rich repeat (LRR) protein